MNTYMNSSVLHPATVYLLQQMLATSCQSLEIDKKLIDRVRQVKSISVTARIPIPILGTAPLFDNVKLVTRTTPNWALYNVSRDPLWQKGNFPVPRRHLQRLNRLYHNGIEFDALYVAHELPLHFDHESDKLELSLIEPAPPEKATWLAQKFGLVTDDIVAMYAAAIKRPIQALAVLNNRGTMMLTDPILMGTIIPSGVNPEEGVPAVWFLLAAWRW